MHLDLGILKHLHWKKKQNIEEDIYIYFCSVSKRYFHILDVESTGFQATFFVKMN